MDNLINQPKGRKAIPSISPSQKPRKAKESRLHRVVATKTFFTLPSDRFIVRPIAEAARAPTFPTTTRFKIGIASPRHEEVRPRKVNASDSTSMPGEQPFQSLTPPLLLADAIATRARKDTSSKKGASTSKMDGAPKTPPTETASPKHGVTFKGSVTKAAISERGASHKTFAFETARLEQGLRSNRDAAGSTESTTTPTGAQATRPTKASRTKTPQSAQRLGSRSPAPRGSASYGPRPLSDAEVAISNQDLRTNRDAEDSTESTATPTGAQSTRPTKASRTKTPQSAQRLGSRSPAPRGSASYGTRPLSDAEVAISNQDLRTNRDAEDSTESTATPTGAQSTHLPTESETKAPQSTQRLGSRSPAPRGSASYGPRPLSDAEVAISNQDLRSNRDAEDSTESTATPTGAQSTHLPTESETKTPQSPQRLGSRSPAPRGSATYGPSPLDFNRRAPIPPASPRDDAEAASSEQNLGLNWGAGSTENITTPTGAKAQQPTAESQAQTPQRAQRLGSRSSAPGGSTNYEPSPFDSSRRAYTPQPGRLQRGPIDRRGPLPDFAFMGPST